MLDLFGLARTLIRVLDVNQKIRLPGTSEFPLIFWEELLDLFFIEVME